MKASDRTGMFRMGSHLFPDPIDDPSLGRLLLSLLAAPFMLIWYGFALLGALIQILLWGMIALIPLVFVALIFAAAFGVIG